LNIANLPWQADNDAQSDIHAEIRSKGKKSKKPFQKDQRGLFDKEGE
jgi:hypothetical protein